MAPTTSSTAASSGWNSEPGITPRVFEEREFREIAEDFSNPCEIFREAISNAFDAGATQLSILLSTVKKGSRDILRIVISDNGSGMTRDQLQAFFDLGNSTSKGRPGAIGDKGHGTKIYYKSSRIEVVTSTGNGTQYRAEVASPYDSLANEQMPTIVVSSCPGQMKGTVITVDDYNHSIRDKFTHAILKDYVYWFTKFGSVEQQFGRDEHKKWTLRLAGVDHSGEPETLTFGHVFPLVSKKLDKLLDEFRGDAPEHFVKKWSQSGKLKNFPDVSWEAVFYLEGDSSKRSVNPMIKGKGKKIPGNYSVQERYGLWLCKDYIPVQRMNEWITVKGSEFTKFHAFVNCQGFRLTANRGSVFNTPPEILDDVRAAVIDFYRTEILSSAEFSDLEWLEGQASAFVTAEKDEKDFEKRLKRLSSRKVAKYKGAELVQPTNEIGVLALVTAIEAVNPSALPFRILDYTTYRGYDALASVGRDDLPIEKLSKGYLEFKYSLQKTFNHLFKHLFAVVCWDFSVSDGDEITDIGDSRRKFRIVPGDKKKKEYTKYWLEDDHKKSRIEVFVLSEFLPDRLGIHFSAGVS